MMPDRCDDGLHYLSMQGSLPDDVAIHLFSLCNDHIRQMLSQSLYSDRKH